MDTIKAVNCLQQDIYYNNYGVDYCYNGENQPQPTSIWLPRQDQLQEILNLPLNDLLDVFIGFIHPTSNIVIVNEISEEKKEEFKEAWVKSMKQCTPAMVLDENINLPTITRIFSFLTLEQFWLGIVMQYKYNKFWNFETKTWEVK